MPDWGRLGKGVGEEEGWDDEDDDEDDGWGDDEDGWDKGWDDDDDDDDDVLTIILTPLFLLLPSFNPPLSL